MPLDKQARDAPIGNGWGEGFDYPEVKVGDLVKMICPDRFTPGSDIGIVVKVVDCGRWADDVVVLSGDGDFVEWEQDELKVIQ